MLWSICQSSWRGSDCLIDVGAFLQFSPIVIFAGWNRLLWLGQALQGSPCDFKGFYWGSIEDRSRCDNSTKARGLIANFVNRENDLQSAKYHCSAIHPGCSWCDKRYWASYTSMRRLCHRLRSFLMSSFLMSVRKSGTCVQFCKTAGSWGKFHYSKGSSGDFHLCQAPWQFCHVKRVLLACCKR